jgi:hypothetical protein
MLEINSICTKYLTEVLTVVVYIHIVFGEQKQGFIRDERIRR